MNRSASALLALVLCSASATASVSMPSLFSDHMVLQRDVPLTVWGWGTPGEQVTVSLENGTSARPEWVNFEFGGQPVSVGMRILWGTVVDTSGNWSVTFPPRPAGTGYTMRVRGHNQLVFKDIAMGDVWVGSGQSNMEMSVASSANAQAEIAAAQYPNIRLFTVPRRSTEYPLVDAYGSWSQCSPETVGSFSALAYFFGRELHKNLNVPIGLIHTSWGGTPAEAWTPRSWLRTNTVLGGRLAAYLEGVRTYPQRKAAYDVELAAAGQGPQPEVPGGGPGSGGAPGGLYQGMIAPLVKFPVRGAIWYQGESNAGEPELYAQLFPMMITAWRQAWNRPDLPFYFVQLANFDSGFNWAWVREAQMAALNLPHTGAALAIDIGAARNIHPTNKQDLGKRLALQALADAYRKPVEANGPTYNTVKFAGGGARISFANARGLNARGGAPSGLEIAGEDRKFFPATGVITGETLVVSAPEVANPVAVRYAWASNPTANLYNANGLPALPFRTDRWPR